MIDREEGMRHIHNVMHVFIEGIAAGLYDNLDDIQCDACEYLAMERAVDKLSNWKPEDGVDSLSTIFDGVSNSITQRQQKQQEDEQWQDIVQTMPKLEEEENDNSVITGQER